MNDKETLRRRAVHLARPVAVPDEGLLAILVRINEQLYAFQVAEVARASVIPGVTALPHVPPVVLGLGTSDGEVLAVFEGRIWAGGSRRQERQRIPVLLLGTAAGRLAFAVDAFVGTATLGPNLARTANAPGWLLGLAAQGELVVSVAALLADPMFTLASGLTDGDADDDHQED